ncbi:ABC-type zinc uptake system zinc chaperone [Shewanella colwelliana]|uniref:ABC-type zinc uptake system zinc chaperone n=1 Tax=Shewanella colwelliana TaxID=23 RepID=UPI0022AEC8D7|nr:ABC-type zinc uptake system zinc chaperone [Shewanella colwelliana]MCZ4337154.1 ABC-type zinc uptake system zinc chaperone [Shewanella colwelliana]
MAYRTEGLARGVAIWLSAILFCLSVAAPAHSLEHVDDGAKNHCTLCIQKVQLNSLLPVGDFIFTLPSPIYEKFELKLTVSLATHIDYFHSRAPPKNS